MKIDNLAIIEQLERLGAAFPWDAVDMWIQREPAGKYSFTSYVRDNPKFGFDSVFGHGDSPQAAVDEIINLAKQRDPEISRNMAIRKLQDKIAKLESVIVGLPPYKPNRELARVNVPSTVDV